MDIFDMITLKNRTSLEEITKYPILAGETNVVDKHYPYGNVKRYGAKGNANYFNSSDGKYYEDSSYTIESADDTIAIQNAIDALKNRIKTNLNFAMENVITIPAGNYKVTSTIKVSPYVKIFTSGFVNILSHVTSGATFQLCGDSDDFKTLTLNGVSIGGQIEWLKGKWISGDGGLQIVYMGSDNTNAIGLEIGYTTYVDGHLYPACYFTIDDVIISKFGVGVFMHTNNNFINNFNHVQFQMNGIGLKWGASSTRTNSGERMTYNECVWGDNTTAAIQINATGFLGKFIACSFDMNGSGINNNSTATLDFIGCHIEGNGKKTALSSVSGFYLGVGGTYNFINFENCTFVLGTDTWQFLFNLSSPMDIGMSNCIIVSNTTGFIYDGCFLDKNRQATIRSFNTVNYSDNVCTLLSANNNLVYNGFFENMTSITDIATDKIELFNDNTANFTLTKTLSADSTGTPFSYGRYVNLLFTKTGADAQMLMGGVRSNKIAVRGGENYYLSGFYRLPQVITKILYRSDFYDMDNNSLGSAFQYVDTTAFVTSPTYLNQWVFNPNVKSFKTPQNTAYVKVKMEFYFDNTTDATDSVDIGGLYLIKK